MTFKFHPWLVVLTAGAVALAVPAINGAGIVVNEVANSCAPGTFSLTGKTPCNACPVGSFAGDWSSTSCQEAKPGFYVPAVGARSPTACEPNTFSEGGSSSCEPCGPTDACFVDSGSHTVEKRSRYTKKRPPAVQPSFCRNGLKSCPIYGRWYGDLFVKKFECTDVMRTLESCGGCVTDDSLDGEINALGGRDCSAIPGVDTVQCIQGRCAIEKCRWGYAPTVGGSYCRSIYGK